MLKISINFTLDQSLQCLPVFKTPLLSNSPHFYILLLVDVTGAIAPTHSKSSNDPCYEVQKAEKQGSTFMKVGKRYYLLERRRHAGPRVQEFNLIKGFAVFPYFISLRPDPGIGAVHEGNQKVKEDDGDDPLEHGPHDNTHQVGELQGYVIIIRITCAVPSFTPSDGGKVWLSGIIESPEHCSNPAILCC